MTGDHDVRDPMADSFTIAPRTASMPLFTVLRRICCTTHLLGLDEHGKRVDLSLYVGSMAGIFNDSEMTMPLMERHIHLQRTLQRAKRTVVCVSVALGACASPPAVQSPTQENLAGERSAAILPSWQEGAARTAILTFVAEVTQKDASTYVQPEARVAVFDSDGTLWSERPMPFQFSFMVDQMKAAAPRHPEWKTNAAYKALLDRDNAALAKNKKALLQLLALANSGMTTDDYDILISTWLARATHPSLNRRYADLVYQPQLELFDLLRSNGFRIWIVSAGTAQFTRAWAGKAYSVPPENVVGTGEKLRYEVKSGKPVLVREPGIAFVDDGAGKPVSIFRAIGRRPILAFGNSNGDRQMLAYTLSGRGPTLALVLHHDDAAREFAYGRKSAGVRLDNGGTGHVAGKCVVVSMEHDWKTVYPAAKPATAPEDRPPGRPSSRAEVAQSGSTRVPGSEQRLLGD